MTKSHVEQAVAARIAAARRRTEDMRRKRAELAAARKRGLAQRHAQKLRNLRGPDGNAGMGQSPTAEPDRGDTATVDSVRATDATPEQQ